MAKNYRNRLKAGLLILTIVCLLSVVFFLITGCDDNKKFKIQYVYNGIQTLEVQDGELYQLESIPSKTGYEFIGLFNSEDGGTKYVDKNGISTFPFSDKKDIILYVRFAPIVYAVVFEVGEGTLTDTASYELTYGSKFVDMPIASSSIAYMNFVGWYIVEQRNNGIPFQKVTTGIK